MSSLNESKPRKLSDLELKSLRSRQRMGLREESAESQMSVPGLDRTLSIVKGDIGPRGVRGPKGDTGLKGEQGLIGDEGPVGPEGTQGRRGPKGEDGVRGLTGASGEKGESGTDGKPGPDGKTGPQGPQGLTGERGSIGIRGEIGLPGPIGPLGLEGPVGPVGPMGPEGKRGIVGATGSMGLQGNRGPMGIQGPQGVMGSPGPQGRGGIKGPKGAKGDKGEPGTDQIYYGIIGGHNISDHSGSLSHGVLTNLLIDDHTQYLLAAGTRVGSTSQAQDFGSTGIKTDVIAESSGDAGVTIDSVLLKDGEVGPLADNKSVIFGTDSDATILYDGTDLVIDLVTADADVKITGGNLLMGIQVINWGAGEDALAFFNGTSLIITGSKQSAGGGAELILQASSGGASGFVLLPDAGIKGIGNGPTYLATNKIYRVNNSDVPIGVWIEDGFIRPEITLTISNDTSDGVLQLGEGADKGSSLLDAGRQARITFTDGADTILIDEGGTTRMVLSSSAPFADITGNLLVDGSTNVVQLTVQAHSAQATDIFLIEKSDNTELLAVDNDGNTDIAGTLGVTGAATLSSTVSITDKLTVTDDVLIDGKADVVQLTVQAHSSQNEKVLVVEQAGGTVDLLTVDGLGQTNISPTLTGQGNWTGLLVSPTITTAGNTRTVRFFASGGTVVHAAGSDNHTDEGMRSDITLQNSGASTTVASLRGARTVASLVTLGGDVTIGEMSGLSAGFVSLVTIAGSAVINALYGLRFEPLSTLDDGDLTIDNGYGLFIGQLAGSSFNAIFPIWQDSQIGINTFKAATVFNEDQVDVDFRIEGNSDNDLFFVDASTDRVGISTPTPLSVFDVLGSFGANITAISSATTLNSTHYAVTCDASGGAFTVTLPAASGITRRIYHIKKTDSSGNAVTVDANDSETIDGALTQVINVQYDSMMIICDGSNWHIT